MIFTLLVALIVDSGPKLEEDPGHGAVTRLHQRHVTIIIMILEHGVRGSRVHNVIVLLTSL